MGTGRPQTTTAAPRALAKQDDERIRPARRIRVLVADDHTMVREGIVGILKGSGDIDVVGEAGDGAEATRKALETRPDVVVLDVSMPRLSGLEAARRIREALPETRVLILTMHDEEEYVVKTVRAGASGYLVKGGAASRLIAGIRALAEGKSYFGSRARATLSDVSDGEPEEPYDRLTDREREVFQLV